MKYLSFCFFLLAFSKLPAQQIQPYQLPVTVDGKALPNPFAGGLNVPQFNAVDLDLDGVDELVIFDRSGNAWVPMKYQDGSYHYAPEFLPQLPDINDFVLFRDYNKDGLMDLFANTRLNFIDAMELYTGVEENGRLFFKKYKFPYGTYDIIYYLLNGSDANLYVIGQDYPDINDLDGDGDLDILAFNNGGANVNFFRNMSVEKGLPLDSIQFRLDDLCWGKFHELGNTNTLKLSLDPNMCASFLPNEDLESRHAGSTIMTLDLDGDGDKDALIGDLSYSNMIAVTNGGSKTKAFITSQDTTFPSYDKPVKVHVFPASFHIDIDRDGKRDLLVSPNITGSEDISNVWYYRNTGTESIPHFERQDTNLFTRDMLDIGSNSYPAFADVNADGLIDMILAQGDRFIAGGGLESSLKLFLNTGTAAVPAFALSDGDWLKMKQYSTCQDCPYNFAPCFGDLDHDGDLDLLVGSQYGNLFYFQNTAGAGQPMTFAPVVQDWKGFDVGIDSAPFIYDLNGDGLPDLILGERSGNLNFFPNVGSPSNPDFISDPKTSPNIEKLGGIDTRPLPEQDGDSAPLIFKRGEHTYILVGSGRRHMQVWKADLSNLAGNFERVDSVYGKIKVGSRVKPALADLDQDGYMDLLCGNLRGGLNLFRTDIQSPTSSVGETTALLLDLYPNPAMEWVQIGGLAWTGQEYFSAYNALGQMIKSGPMNSSGRIDISDWTPGIYTLQIRAGKQSGQLKFVKLDR